MSEQGLPPPTFGEWLDDQLKDRKWSRPRLARLIEYSPDTVTSWIHGRRVPEERACDLIADALEIDRNEVRRLANRPEVHEVALTTDTRRVEGEAHLSAVGNLSVRNPLLDIVAENMPELTPDQRVRLVRRLLADMTAEQRQKALEGLNIAEET